MNHNKNEYFARFGFFRMIITYTASGARGTSGAATCPTPTPKPPTPCPTPKPPTPYPTPYPNPPPKYPGAAMATAKRAKKTA